MVGLANNGDFGRMIKWGALNYVQDNNDDIYFNWVNREYKFVANPVTTNGFWLSSEIFFVKLAAAIGYLFVSDKIFDLRTLGLIHILAFLLSFWILMRGLSGGAKFSFLFFAPWFVLLFCDLNYTIYFNSFYTEPATLIFLLASVGSALYLLKLKRGSIPMLALFGICASLLIAVKIQNIIFAPAIAFFGLRLFQFDHSPLRRIILLASVALVSTLSVSEYEMSPHVLKEASKYNSVFYGALMGSHDPRRDLIDLGVNEDYSALAGTNFHQPGLPLDVKSREFEAGFDSKIGFAKIFLFYLKRPGLFLEKIQQSVDRAYFPRPEYAGNFEKSSGEKQTGQSRRWNIWGQVKKYYFPKSVWFLAFCQIVTGSLIFIGWRKSEYTDQKLRWELYFALWMTIPLALITPLLGDGFSDFERHMFAFNILMDLSILLILGHLTDFLAGKLFNHQGAE